MYKIKKIITLLTVFIYSLAFIPNAVLAASASLYLTPDQASQQVGGDFTISVGVNSGGNAINAIEATVNIPTSVVTITAASTGGSLCSIWVQQPTISGSTISFKCGIPGGTTASGGLVSISLHANTAGTGSASITGARILADAGTNVTGGTSGGTYTVTTPVYVAPPAPVYVTPSPSVSSGTHPDPNAWYKNSNPAFSWGSASGFSYVFDQNPSTVPAAQINTSDTSISFTDKADGTWYFHIRANGKNGWSGTTTFRVQIDTTNPTDLDIVTDPKDVADKRPMVSFVAQDAASGIEYYEIKLDQDEFRRATSPYTPERINSGDHVFTVRAFDKVGNMTEGTVKIKIADIPIPKITSPKNNVTLKLAEQLEISGTADPSTKVNIYLDGVKIATDQAVGEDGKWNFTYKNLLMPGKHELFAIAVKDGIESKYSEKVNIRIDAAAVSLFGIIIPSYIIVALVIIIIVIMGFIIFWLFFFVKRRYDKIKEKIRQRNKEAKTAIDKKLVEMQGKLDKDIEVGFDKKNINEEHHLEESVNHDVELTEKEIDEELNKEVKDL
jgi:hypothetical protein